MLEIDVGVAYDGWAGSEQAYVGREDLEEFAAALDQVAAGGLSAELRAGGDVTNRVSIRVCEYGLARRLAIAISLGRSLHATGIDEDRRELRLSVPVERGQLSRFAAALRAVVQAERGRAELPLWTDSQIHLCR
jgi:hypothetical protein